jgi:hypothetical protein
MAISSLDFRYEYGKIVNAGSLIVKEDEKQAVVLPMCEKQLWRKYRRHVWKITERQPLKKLPNYEKRAFKGYHLDHKVSIWYGFKNKIDPKLIGSIHNLEFIPHKDNERKATNCNFKGTRAIQTILYI